MGRSVRGISEIEAGVYHCQGKITDVMCTEDGQIAEIQWTPFKGVVPQRSKADRIELLPALRDRVKLKTGKLSLADRKEIRIRCGNILPKELSDSECLGDAEVVMGAWLFHRDLLRDRLGMAEMPYFTCPQISANMVDAEITEELRCQAAEILKAYVRSRGLIGVPIFSHGHWALLMLRRSNKIIKIRYYDSLKDGAEGDGSESCKVRARTMLNMLGIKDPLPRRSNFAFQIDGTSCGLYMLHWWEGEIRQYVGEGWAVDRPNSTSVKKMRDRLDGMLKQLHDTKKADEEAPKKKAKTVPIIDLEAEDQKLEAIPTLSKIEDLLADLAQRAETAKHHAAVYVYGCCRCRWSRSGCSYYGCNPVKFEAHRAKYPEKYHINKKTLKIDADRKMTDKELCDMAVAEID